MCGPSPYRRGDNVLTTLPTQLNRPGGPIGKTSVADTHPRVVHDAWQPSGPEQSPDTPLQDAPLQRCAACSASLVFSTVQTPLYRGRASATGLLTLPPLPACPNKSVMINLSEVYPQPLPQPGQTNNSA